MTHYFSFRLASRRFIQELFLGVDFSRWTNPIKKSTTKTNPFFLQNGWGSNACVGTKPHLLIGATLAENIGFQIQAEANWEQHMGEEGGRCLGRRGRLYASPLVTICVSWAVLLRFSLEEKLFLVHKTLPGNCTWFLLSDHYIFIVAVYNSDFCNQPVTISTFERKSAKSLQSAGNKCNPIP